MTASRGPAEPRYTCRAPTSSARDDDRLASLGVNVFEGHAAENVRGAHVVVTSTAVRPQNPRSPRPAGTASPSSPREMLAELMRLKYGVAVRAATARPRPPRWSRSPRTARLEPTWWWRRLGVLGSGRGSARASSWWRRRMSRTARSSSSPDLAVVTNIDASTSTPTATSPTSGGLPRLREQGPFYGGRSCVSTTRVQDICRGSSAGGDLRSHSPGERLRRDLELTPTGSHYTATSRAAARASEADRAAPTT